MSDSVTPTPRHDGWSPTRQRDFLEHLAVSGLVRSACAAVGISREAAYKLRQRREGAAFALGWDAALLLARWALADTLMERAVDGQTDVVERDPDTHRRTRHRHDNRLALSVLGRLDRFAEGDAAGAGDARLIAGDWEAFLDLIGGGSEGAGAALFLAARRPAGDAVGRAENDTHGPCQLCGSGGYDDDAPEFTLADKHGDAFIDDGNDSGECDEEGMRDWLSVFVHDGNWVTNFPPPASFDGEESGVFGIDDVYHRSLTDAELQVIAVRRDARIERETAIAQRLYAEVFTPADDPVVA